MKKTSYSKGITLLEWVGIFVIIILIATASLIYISRRHAEGRDLVRENDLLSLQQALSQYHYEYDHYPQRDSGTNIERDALFQQQLSGLKEGNFQDPSYPQSFNFGQKQGRYSYFYRTKDEGAAYHIWAPTEIGDDFIAVASDGGEDIQWAARPQPQYTLYEGKTGLVSSNQGGMGSSLVSTPESAWQKKANQVQVNSTGYGHNVSLDIDSPDLRKGRLLNFEVRQSASGTNMIGFLEKDYQFSLQDSHLQALASDARSSYFVFTGEPLKLGRVSRDHFNQVEFKLLPADVGEVEKLLVDDNFLYLVGNDPVKILKINRETLSLDEQNSLPEIGHIQASALDNQYLYFGEKGKDVLWKVDKTTFQARSVALDKTNYSVSSIVVDAQNIYAGLSAGEKAGLIAKINKENSSIKKQELKPEECRPQAMISTDKFIYVGLDTEPGVIVRLAKKDLNPVSKSLEERTKGILALTQSAKYVYGITNDQSSQVVALNKDDLSLRTLQVHNQGRRFSLLAKEGNHFYIVSSRIFERGEVPRYYLLQIENRTLEQTLAEQEKKISPRGSRYFNPTLGDFKEGVEGTSTVYFLGEQETPYLLSWSKDNLSRLSLTYLDPQLKEGQDLFLGGKYLYLTSNKNTLFLSKMATKDFSVFSKDMGYFRQEEVVADYHGEYVYVAVDTDPLSLLKIRKDNFNDVTSTESIAGVKNLRDMVYRDGALYLSFNTQPARLIKINADSLKIEKKSFLSSGNNNISEVVADDNYLYISLDQSPAKVLKVDQKTLDTTASQQLPDSFNQAGDISLKGQFLQVSLKTKPGRLVRLDKKDLSIMRTRPLVPTEYSSQFVFTDDSFTYTLLQKEKSVGLARLLNYNFLFDLPASEEFQRYSIPLDNLSSPEKEAHLYHHFIFTPAQLQSDFDWSLGNINVTN